LGIKTRKAMINMGFSIKTATRSLGLDIKPIKTAVLSVNSLIHIDHNVIDYKQQR
jgi:hypothetical protein